MVLQNIRKSVEYYKQQLGSTICSSSQQFELLKDLPFYHWEWQASFSENHIQKTSFNHTIGLPQKNGEYYQLFDHEKLVFDTLQNHKHVWIKKATGLSITEFMLRYMAWLCLRNHDLNCTQMCIVTGPRIDLAITFIDRIKKLFINSKVTFDSKETII